MPLQIQTHFFRRALAVCVLLVCLTALAAWYLHHSPRVFSGVALLLFGVGGALAGLLAGTIFAYFVQRRLLDIQRALTRVEQLATLGRVAAALAHELRNPLTSMRIITQSATTSDNQVSLDTRDFSILVQEIERLDSSIQTFLDYARPPHPEKRPCIVQSLVRQTAALVERRAAQTGVEIHYDLPPEPLEFEADPGQMKQVLLNLLINALDASPGGGVVTVRSRVASLGNGSMTSAERSQFRELVEIEIADTGSGLPDSLGDRIFDAFVSTKETGTGLGLAICRRIIEEHDGEINAENAPGGGAVFTVRLPKTPRALTRQPSTPAAPTGPRTGEP
jgi:signal transduction histidine kinase